jgi:hypothetical protein
MTSSEATRARPALTDDQLADMLHLIGGSDSVELKMSIADADRRATIAALGLDPLQAQIRQVFFFDTPDLKVSDAGVIVRARRVQGRGDDSTIKLRPVLPADLSPKLRATPGFVVEVDAMPGKYVCSGSLSAALGKDDVRPVAAGMRPIRKLFSKQQRAFYEAHAPAGIALDDLSVLGPIFVLKGKFTPERFARPMVAELWLYPDASMMLELSTKTLPSQAFQTAAEARSSLARHGVTTSSEQQTKTRKALDIFSSHLRRDAAAAAATRALAEATPAAKPKTGPAKPKAKPVTAAAKRKPARAAAKRKPAAAPPVRSKPAAAKPAAAKPAAARPKPKKPGPAA